MALKESFEKTLNTEELDKLFESIRWRPRGELKWKELLAKSSFVYSMWDGGKAVGLGLIVENGVMCMFYDIVVHPDYQGKGIGKQIMTSLIAQVKDKGYASIGLFAWKQNPNNIPFYEKFGFERVQTGMELVKYMRRE